MADLATRTLIDFLLARIAEDEERAAFVQRQIEDRSPAYEPWMLSWHDEYDLLCVEPVRALAESAAKDALVTAHRGWHVCPNADGRGYTDYGDGSGDEWEKACPTLLAIALAYASHPDFDESWRA